jgi:hypothetical protein
MFQAMRGLTGWVKHGRLTGVCRLSPVAAREGGKGGAPHFWRQARVSSSVSMSDSVLTDEALDEILADLTALDAQVVVETDDYGNPAITVGVPGTQYPVLARQSVIGGEQVVGISSEGRIRTIPGPNGDVFGPIDSAPQAVEEAWRKVVAVFPAAGC